LLNFFKVLFFNQKWKYRAGNNWGCEANGKCCSGCGMIQEEFYGAG
jgi:hypothetical protein